jgi:hypothetical protein
MSRRKHPAPEQHSSKREPGIVFSFQLSLSGIIGIAVVVFCLFLWMFLIGIWAGQTILHPSPQAAAVAPVRAPASPDKHEEPGRQPELVNPPLPDVAMPPKEAEGILLLPTERKKRITLPEQSEE